MKRAPGRLVEVWGQGDGWLSGRAPEVRLLTAACILAAVLVVGLDQAPGAAFLVLTVVLWVLLCGAPWRVLGPALLLGLVMLVPLFALTPWVTPSHPRLVEAATPEPWDAIVVVGALVARGLSALLVTMAALTTLQRWDWHEALARLPMPGAVRAILAQMVHQSGLLADETSRIATAMTVRSGSRSGRHGWRLVTALPRVWLPRVLDRADRTGLAMELRGLRTAIPRFRTISWTWREPAAVGLAAAWLAAAVLLTVHLRP